MRREMRVFTAGALNSKTEKAFIKFMLQLAEKGNWTVATSYSGNALIAPLDLDAGILATIGIDSSEDKVFRLSFWLVRYNPSESTDTGACFEALRGEDQDEIWERYEMILYRYCENLTFALNRAGIPMASQITMTTISESMRDEVEQRASSTVQPWLERVAGTLHDENYEAKAVAQQKEKAFEKACEARTPSNATIMIWGTVFGLVWHFVFLPAWYRNFPNFSIWEFGFVLSLLFLAVLLWRMHVTTKEKMEKLLQFPPAASISATF